MGAGAPSWFAILFYGRVGSTFLIRLLNTHRSVVAFGELFLKAQIGLPMVGEMRRTATRLLNRQKDLVQIRLEEPARFLDRFRDASEQVFRGKSCFGFKLSFNQSPEANRHVMADPSIKKIVLARRNLLGMYSSFKMAQKTNIWHATTVREEARFGTKFSENGDVPTDKVEFSPADFQAFCRDVEEKYTSVRDTLRSRGEDFLELEYAELFRGYGVGDIGSFLEIGASVSFDDIGIVKVGTNNPLLRFSNEQDVLQYLDKHNRLAWAEPEI